MAKITDTQEVNIDLLKPYEKNAKKHGRDQLEKLKKSIKEFGFLTPCLIDAEYNIIAGHGRVMAAKELEMKTVPCVFIEGLTDEQRRAYILADNRLGELGEWDMELVSEELKDLKTGGFDIDLTGFNIDSILFDDDEAAWAEEPEPEIPEEIITEVGDMWQLGDHRLLVGDSTSKADVERLMGKESADMLITDPPYNVAYSGKAGEIINDDMASSEFKKFLLDAFTNASIHMKPGAAFYCWYGSSEHVNFESALGESGLIPHQILVWVKSKFTLGRQDYQWKHEQCFYGWKEGAAHYFIDVRSLGTVEDDIDKLTREQAIEYIKRMNSTSTTIYEDIPNVSELHPTMKPLGLFKKQIRNSSVEGNIVMDLFGGSGTALIACEEMNRKCRMMEYDPKYASAIIKRWETETGQTARRI